MCLFTNREEQDTMIIISTPGNSIVSREELLIKLQNADILPIEWSYVYNNLDFLTPSGVYTLRKRVVSSTQYVPDVYYNEQQSKAKLV